jgi:glycolate oxidase FAD binding subunit
MTTAHRIPPHATVRPTSLREAHEALRDTHGAEQVVRFRGGGTADWGAPGTAADVLVDTRGMDRPLAHNPSDMTVAVQAGMSLRTLQDLLEPAGQWLAIDPARARRGATVGGLLATADAGPRRLAHGTLRDLVIGTTVVLPDATVARSGGHVIKNVAGYDLAKLFHGSFGTLGLIAEVVFRLHPRPRASATVRVDADVASATRHALALMAAPLEPTAVEWDGGALLVRFDGTPGGTEAQAAEAVRLLGNVGADAQRLTEDAAEEAWQGIDARIDDIDAAAVLRAGTLPGRLPEVSAALTEAAEASGVRADLVSSVCAGVHTARVHPADPAAVRAFVTSWRVAIIALNGTVTLRRRAAEVDRDLDCWGPPPAAVTVLRHVKNQFDPDNRCNPGRFAPWF